MVVLNHYGWLICGQPGTHLANYACSAENDYNVLGALGCSMLLRARNGSSDLQAEQQQLRLAGRQVTTQRIAWLALLQKAARLTRSCPACCLQGSTTGCPPCPSVPLPTT